MPARPGRARLGMTLGDFDLPLQGLQPPGTLVASEGHVDMRCGQQSWGNFWSAESHEGG